MQLIEDMDLNLKSITRVMTESLCNVGLVVENIARDIIHSIKVIDLIFTVLKRQRQFEMLSRAFLKFMQHWIIGRLIIMHLLSRWKEAL